MLAATNAQRFGGMPGATPSASMNREVGANSSSRGFVWETPEGWTAKAPTSMREANFQVGDDPNAECYLTVLAGMGGGLISNVNRWRQQIGLPPQTDAEILALPKRLLFGNEATIVELEGAFKGMGDEAEEGFGLLGAILSMQEGTLFVKLTGPIETVRANRAQFDQFCDSLDKDEPGAAEHDHSAHETQTSATKTASDSSGGLAFEAPKSWQEQPPRSMRIVSYQVGSTPGSECYITGLSGDAGGVEANINRWRSQVGAEPLSQAEIAALPTLTILGTPSPWMEAYGDFSGMGAEDQSDAGILGAICNLGNQTLFLKMLGPSSLLKSERDNFIQFCESLRVE